MVAFMALVRRALVSDAQAIAQVHVESWRSTYAGIVPDSFLAQLDEAERAMQWREWLAQDVLILVAETEEEVVGFSSGGAIREPVEDCDAELYAIYLLERAQRSKIGTELLRQIAAALRERGFRSMAVWVLEKNRCKGFYLKQDAGYARSKEIEIGGAMLMEEAYTWSDLKSLGSGDFKLTR